MTRGDEGAHSQLLNQLLGGGGVGAEGFDKEGGGPPQPTSYSKTNEAYLTLLFVEQAKLHGATIPNQG